MIQGGELSFAYDERGNQSYRYLNSAQTDYWHYSWNAENQLIQAELTEAGTTVRTLTFAYDAFGRRMEKQITENGTTKTTSYVYDGEDILLSIDNDGSTTTATYFIHGPGIDEPLAMVKGGSSHYYHADGLGSIVAITDSSQTIVQHYDYDTFGQLTASDDFANGYTFTGREWDDELGLYYYRARYYDAQIGRFISKDPIGFAGGDVNIYRYVDGVGKPFLNPNLYHYTDNNPINGTDPLGLFTIQIGAGGTIGAGAGGTATSGIVISYDNEKGLQIGVYSNVGGGGHGGANLSGTYEFLYSANDEICDLAGGSTSIGGSVGVARIFSSGAEVNIMHGDAAPSEGIVFGLGPGTKVEEHGYVTSTTIIRIW